MVALKSTMPASSMSKTNLVPFLLAFTALLKVTIGQVQLIKVLGLDKVTF